MESEILDRYIDKKISWKNLRMYSREIFEYELQRNKNRCQCEIKFQVIWAPGLSNGYVRARKKTTCKFKIWINLFPFLKNNISNRMKYFYVYATILHELEHAYFEINAYEHILEYPYFVATLEQIQSEKKTLMEKMCLFLFARDKYKWQETSILEGLCNERSMERAKRIFKSYLTLEEKATVDVIYEGFVTWNSNVELGYDSSGWLSNQFIQNMLGMKKCFKRDTLILKNYPQLSEVFNHNGDIKGIEELYRNINVANKELYKEIMIRQFINADKNFQEVFEELPELKQYLEVIANKYCEKNLKYIRNQQVLGVLIHKSILKDNILVILNNMKRLNKLMKQYCMAQTNGSMFELEDM